MLQEATKALNSAFNNSFIKKLSQYLHDCVREEVKSSTFRNLKADKANKWIFLKEDETLLTKNLEYLKLSAYDSKITELLLQSSSEQKDKYLIYGYLFLVGKSSKKRSNEFLTPLLYAPCRLEKNGVNINLFLTEEMISLNTGAITALMKKADDDDEVEQVLKFLLDAVPKAPITQEKLDIFLTTLKSIIPDVDVSLNPELTEDDNVTKEKDFYKEKETIDADNIDDFIEEEEKSQKAQVKLDKICLTRQSAIILTKRPATTAGVLHELTQIAERPSGIYRETALNVINEEYLQSKGKQLEVPKPEGMENFLPLTPLSLSDSQENVIRQIEMNKIVSVFGPPGTGKSQTIVNLVAHLIAEGKTVLVASKMDKAVDVIADRLNNLGAPFLALRAGRLDYQRKLKYQLEDLAAGKFDLNENLEDIIFSEVDDIKKLLNDIKTLEDNCEKIINFEGEWQKAEIERKNREILLGERKFISQILKKQDVEDLNNSIKSIENNFDKSGFIVNLQNYSAKEKIKKILNLKDFEVNETNTARLKDELSYAKIERRLKLYETEIQKIGNLHLLIDEIHNLKSKQHSLVTNVLKAIRVDSLKGLRNDSQKRGRLLTHAKSLVSRQQNLQNRLLETEDFKPLLEAFPCWCVTTYAVSSSLPMKPALFDVAIIDEASQCDIASCFPILFRAKKAVIVGDDKQLPHLSFLEKAKEQSFLSQYGIPDRYQLMWKYRSNSMFDIANFYCNNPVLLDEHFRSLPPIINFSNHEFYADRIKIMHQNSSKEKVLEIVNVPDGKMDSECNITRNTPEIEAVVRKVHEIILEDERKNPDKPITIGIISPFRAQVDQLKISIRKVISERMMQKHEIEIGTAHAFQGDERDIILMSWAYANDSHPQSLTFLQKPNLFNVAITRAKYKVINFVSKDVNDLPDGLFRSYLEYIREYNDHFNAVMNNEIDENSYKNPLEKEIAQKIKELGYSVKAGAEIAGLSADLLVGNDLIIEIDGVEDNKKTHIPNMKKQSILERSGFKVNRITAREWSYSPQICLDRIFKRNENTSV
ncbi:AAA family ATPase [bacterium]|nr:AAA family ATPase [bacterium]